jgi:transcriptional regulator NrdR family protein
MFARLKDWWQRFKCVSTHQEKWVAVDSFLNQDGQEIEKKREWQCTECGRTYPR